jgi:phosphoribosylamine---glycine ligase
VVKADGLAAGKGVIICESRRPPSRLPRACSAASCWARPRSRWSSKSSSKATRSAFLCLSDGKHVAPLVPAQDHKRIGEGDTGPNTGGMGVYSTDTLLDAGMTEWILHHIAEPTIRGMAEEDTPFVGVLYCGLMMTARGPQVLEFNARFGDPETQAILLRLESDLVDALEAASTAASPKLSCAGAPGASACVVASSAGYPGSYKTGFPSPASSAAAQVPGVQVFHSGSSRGRPTAHRGGRVLGVPPPLHRSKRLWPALTRPWPRFILKESTFAATSATAP